MGNKPVMKILLDCFEQHGPMSVDEVSEKSGIGRQSAYCACYDATSIGYLTVMRKKITNGKGRMQCIYTRTDKVYQFYLPRENVRPGRNEARRKQEREESAARRQEQEQLHRFVPFRHPHDSALFGPWTQPVQISEVPRRTVEKWA